MKFTLELFTHLTKDLPPLLPDEVLLHIRKNSKTVKDSKDIKEIENTMVAIGYQIWPWRQALREFVKTHDEHKGEKYFLGYLPEYLKNKFHEYQHLGLMWKDFISGKTAHYFNEEDRILLVEAIINYKNDIKKLVEREVVGLKKNEYLKKVDDYKNLLKKIQFQLNGLRQMAKNEPSHENLAAEIMAKVEAFEHGLCMLAPEIHHSELEEYENFFLGRRKDLNRLRGIHETVEIDFYN